MTRENWTSSQQESPTRCKNASRTTNDRKNPETFAINVFGNNATVNRGQKSKIDSNGEVLQLITNFYRIYHL